MRRVQPAVAFFLAGGLLTVGYPVLQVSAVPKTVLYELVSLSTVAAVAFALRTARSAPSAAGWWFLAGLSLFAAGDLLWSLNDVFGVAIPVSHGADVFYLAEYPCFGWALVLLSARRREPNETRLRQLVDAAVLFVAGFSALWFLLLDHVVARGGESLVDTVLLVAYPTFDLALLCLVARFVFSSGRWPFGYRIFTAGF